MEKIQNLINLVKQIDLFRSNQLIRYKTNSQYSTLTGGILSISIISIIIVAFSKDIFITLKKQKLTYSMSTNINGNPHPINITTGLKNNFMIGITIGQESLTGKTRQVDVMASVAQLRNKTIYINTIKLQPCTKDHWGQVADQIWKQDEQLDRQDGGFDPRQWLCLPINQSLSIYGTQGFDFSRIQFTVTKCSNHNNQLYQNMESVCIQNQKTKLLQFFVKYIDTAINPHLKNPIQYFINQNRINIQYGRWNTLQSFLTDYSINTDISILPYQNIENVGGAIFQQYQKPISYKGNPDTFVSQFFLKKGRKQITYNRQVSKISTIISYIGGFIGAIIAFLFFLSSYTSFALQVTLASNIFQNQEIVNVIQDRKQNKKRKQIKQINIFNFCAFELYKLISKINKKINWPYYRQLQNHIQQINNHLDINILIRRIISLQYYVFNLFQKDQFESLRKNIPNNYRRIKQYRLKFQNQLQDNNIIKLQVQTQEQFINKPQTQQKQLKLKNNLQEISNIQLKKQQNLPKQHLQHTQLQKQITKHISSSQNNKIFKKKIRKSKQLSLRMSNLKIQLFENKNELVPVKYQKQDQFKKDTKDFIKKTNSILQIQNYQSN